MRWVPVWGELSVSDDVVTFPGGSVAIDATGQSGPSWAATMTDQRFGGGAIEARITFDAVSKTEACALVLFYQPANQAFITAQLGGDFLCSLWSYAGNRWNNHGAVGSGDLIEAHRQYTLRATAQGSEVRFTLDGVEILKGTLPIPLPDGQAGLWFRGHHQIAVEQFRVIAAKPKAFVVMQYTPPYNELFAEVVLPVCQHFELKAERAADKYGPGVIIQDIEQQILEARLVIAEITPHNPNVYYEVGYAHALKKQTILIAESPTQLPFDVSPFRVLFYENTIAGKAKIEAGLRRHLDAILGTNTVEE